MNQNVGAVSLLIPGRWDFERRTHEQGIAEVERLAEVLSKSAEAVVGLYMRVCDLIRRHKLTDAEIRAALKKHFPPQRVSEFVKIANAREETYRRYTGGFIGFRSALEECRGYRIQSCDELKQKKIRRAAERLIMLTGGAGEVSVCGKLVTISPCSRNVSI